MKTILFILFINDFAQVAFAGSSPAELNCDKDSFYIIGTVPADEIQIDLRVENEGKRVNLIDKDTENTVEADRKAELKESPKYYVDSLKYSNPRNPQFLQHFTSKDKTIELKITERPKSIRESKTEDGLEYFFDTNVFVKIPKIFPGGKALQAVRCRWTYRNP